MRKFIFITTMVFTAMLAITSCKKEDEVTPAKVVKSQKLVIEDSGDQNPPVLPPVKP